MNTIALKQHKRGAGSAARSTRWLVVVLPVLLFAMAFQFNGYAADLFNKLLLVTTLTLSFTFLFGVAGQLALSHVAFYGIGAYTVTVLSVSLGLPVWLAIPATIAICVAVALIIAIPTVRLDGFYLALATLALAQLFTVVLVHGGKITGGSEGLYGFSNPSLFGIALTGRFFSLLIVALFLISLGLLIRLDRSWFGRACRAIRDNPAAARAMGVNPTSIKVTVFVITSLIACVSGIVYVFLENYVTPYVFNLDFMFQIIFMAIIGGLGSLTGAIIGAVLLYIASEYMGFLGDHFLLVYGALTVLSILFAPRGIVGLLDRTGVKLP